MTLQCHQSKNVADKVEILSGELSRPADNAPPEVQSPAVCPEPISHSGFLKWLGSLVGRQPRAAITIMAAFTLIWVAVLLWLVLSFIKHLL